MDQLTAIQTSKMNLVIVVILGLLTSIPTSSHLLIEYRQHLLANRKASARACISSTLTPSANTKQINPKPAGEGKGKAQFGLPEHIFKPLSQIKFIVLLVDKCKYKGFSLHSKK